MHLLTPAGPIADQSIKLELNPNETIWRTEYWIPSDQEMDIYSLKLPQERLRPINDIPFFGWSRNEEVDIWLQLKNAYLQSATPPPAPLVTANRWAPSGMEDLQQVFEWAIYSSEDNESNLWKFYYGTWLAGRDRIDEAINMLSTSNTDLSKVVLARLHNINENNADAIKAISSISEKWLQLHPQVVVERDILLRTADDKSIAEREKWLSMVNALDDEWIIERRVQLLIDKNEINAAKELLLGTHFQPVHQTYSRTNLWKQICERLGKPYFPIPVQLGEDNLATFGAYREFE
ncbi:MAG: hypothetical protein LBI15_05280 [Dysgonamonadaceae bacterium]|nr:hypothetical protein [Dysgonamonadaceae bacterium]